MKKLLLFIAILISTMGLFAQNIGDNTIIDYDGYSLTFTVTSIEPAECEVYCSTHPTSSTEIVIPSSVTIEGMEFSVTRIDDYAFRYCSTLIGLEMPNTITSIGYWAFYSCYNLANINFSNSLHRIQTEAFCWCHGLIDIELPNSLTQIDNRAFANCWGLINVSFGENSELINIEGGAFNCCTHLKNIDIPSNVTNIGIGAFKDCYSLYGVRCYADVVPTTASNVFENTLSTFSIQVPEQSIDLYKESEPWSNYKITKIYSVMPGDSIVLNYGNYLSRYTVTSVEPNECEVFCSRKPTTSVSVTIPSNIQISGMDFGVTSIADEAFADCSLIGIEIPSSIKYIGEDAFWACEGIESIIIDENNAIYDSRNNCHAIIETATNTLILGCKSTTIPNSVTSIGNRAFMYSYINGIEIPSSVRSIGEYAFWNCNGLTNVKILGATTIGENAFHACYNLTNIELSNNITSIGENAFSNCSKLYGIRCYAEEVPTTESSAFNNLPSNLNIQVPEQSVDLYKASSPWNNYEITKISSAIAGDYTIVDYGDYSLKFTIIGIEPKRCEVVCSTKPSKETTIIIPSTATISGVEYTVTSIGNSAFSYCQQLKGIEIPNTINSIGSYSFSGCSELYGIRCYAEEVPSAANNAFDNNNYKLSIQVPEQSVDLYKASEPWNNYEITKISSVVAGDYTIVDYGDYSLKFTIIGFEPKRCEVVCSTKPSKETAITIPSTATISGNEYTVTSIGNSAFSYCQQLKGIEIPNTITYIGSSAFYNCDKITDIKIPENVTHLNDNVFSNCNKLANVEISNSVIHIGNSVFGHCENLKGIEIPNSVTYIGDYAFGWCTKLTNIEIPTSVSSFGGNPFQACYNLETITVKDGNPNYDSRNNCNAIIETSTNTLISGCKNSIIPYGITTIGEDAFAECHNLTSIEIPSSVTTLECYAFSSCSSLTEIIIPNSVTTIGCYAFSWCNGLTDIDIPNGVTTIKYCAFVSCDGLKNIKLPQSLTLIEENVFDYCSNLETITIENGNAVYDSRDNCNAIIETASNTLLLGSKNTIIPNTVTSIAGNAFNCSDIKRIKISNSINYIGDNAFANCNELGKIVSYAENVPLTESNAFYEVPSDMVIYVPANSFEAYKSASPWNNFTIDTLPNGNYCIKHYENYSLEFIVTSTEPAECEVICSVQPTVPTEIIIPSSVNIGSSTINSSTEIIIGAESSSSNQYIPTYEYYDYSVTQQIYTAEELQISDGEMISSVAFRQTESVSDTRELDVYMLNTDVESFTDGSDWFEISSGNLVFSGIVSYPAVAGEWLNLEFEKSFEYAGGNVVLCVVDKTGSWKNGKYYDTFNAGTNRGIYAYRDGTPYDINDLPSGNMTSDVNIVKFNVTNSGEIYTVTSIGDDAFYSCNGLTSIEIPNSVTYIGNSAFGGTGLTSIVFPNGVTSIGTHVINSCPNIESVEISSSLTEIGEYNFIYCPNLKSIKVDSNNPVYDSRNNCNAIIETETNTLIAGCYNTNIPNTVSSIGKAAFVSCDNLVSIEIPNSVISIEMYAFRECDNLTNLTFEENSKLKRIGTKNEYHYYGEGAFYNCLGLTNIEIPNSVTYIGPSTFENCSNLTSITFGENSQLDTISYNAFGYCYSLPSITIPENVSFIESSVFIYCTALESISVEEGNSVYDSRNDCNAIIETATNTLIQGCKSSIIPNTVTSIGNSAFYSCNGLTSVTISNNITSIGNYAFYDCSSLASVIFENNSQLTTIGNYAFYDCDSITNIKIPKTVTSIGNYAFSWCDSLTKIVCYAENVPETGENTIYGGPSNLTIYVPAQSLEAYKAASPWNNYTILPIEITNHWVSDESLYANNMSVIGLIQIDGVDQNSTSLEIGAFCGEEVRGSQIIQYIPALDKYLVFLTIHGDSSDEISFKLYDHSIGQELDLRSPEAITFTVNGTLGSITYPYILNFSNMVNITAIVNPENAGTVSGAGEYAINDIATLNATSNEGYQFINWTEEGTIVSEETEYSFTVTESRELVANFELLTYNVTASANPAEGGSINGAGIYTHGETATLNATANEGYQFISWTENGTIVSEESEYSFTVTETKELVANFELLTYNVTASANPAEGGSINGAGIYTHGEAATLNATANAGFSFKNWTENGNVVSENPEYSFIVTESKELVANFNYVQSRDLKSGWNWFSSYIDIDGEEGLEIMEDALGENGLQIKSQTAFVSNSSIGWYGSLTSVSVENMYMIETSSDVEFMLVGDNVNPEDHPISIETNWRWFAYILDHNVSVEEALATIVPHHGDYVKSKTSFSQYYEGIGWIGALNTMNTGEGYMYQNTSGMIKTLVYPTTATKSMATNVTSENNHWVPEVGKYADNMSMIAFVKDNSGMDYEIGAFAGEELRGSARPIYIEPLDMYMVFITIYGEGGEEISFRYYDLLTEEEQDIFTKEKVFFSANATYGSIDSPLAMMFDIDGIDENTSKDITVYPNPAKANSEVNLGMTCDRVEIYNTLGVKVAEYANVNKIDGIETAGVYMIRLTNDNEIRNYRVVVE